MISLLGSLLGFGSPLIGPVLEAWNKNSDQKHELAMLHAQAEIQSKIQDQKLEATIVEADMAEDRSRSQGASLHSTRKGPQWLAALSGSVRPVVTYLIILEWLAINWAIAWIIIDEEGVTVYNLRAILDTDFMGLVSCVIAFWFGNRTFGKRKTYPSHIHRFGDKRRD